MRLHRLAVPAVIAVCTFTATPALAAAPCATNTPARATTLCLINAQRAAHGVRALRLDARLNLSSVRHSRDMVAHRYFAHESRSGARFSARIARTGWMSGRGRWSVGENLAWGSGVLATPRWIVRAWMQSTEHRQNMLSPRYHVIGIGIVSGTPSGAAGSTYTADFGS